MSLVVDNEAMGAHGEHHARRQYPIGLVPDDVDERIDAVFVRDLVSGPETPVPGVTIIDAGTLVEVKVTTLRVSDSGSTRYGRYFIDRANHEYLLEQDGHYILLVYCEHRGWLRQGLIRASSVEAVIDESEWHQNGDLREGARPAWSRFYDVETTLRGGLR